MICKGWIFTKVYNTIDIYLYWSFSINTYFLEIQQWVPTKIPRSGSTSMEAQASILCSLQVPSGRSPFYKSIFLKLTIKLPTISTTCRRLSPSLPSKEKAFMLLLITGWRIVSKTGTRSPAILFWEIQKNRNKKWKRRNHKNKNNRKIMNGRQRRKSKRKYKKGIKKKVKVMFRLRTSWNKFD